MTEPEISRARIVVIEEPETEDDVGLPEAWETFDDGTPQPNWVEARSTLHLGLLKGKVSLGLRRSLRARDYGEPVPAVANRRR